jgi:hypothetical protein
MNSNTVNNADRCLSDTVRHNPAEQTSDTIDAIGAEHTRKIAEALIEQLTKEEDAKSADARLLDRINKLKDSSKLFEPLRKPVRIRRKVTSAEPAKKLLKELLEQGNAQLTAKEKAPGNEGDHPTCDAEMGCEAKLTKEQVKAIVLQSAITSVDLAAQKSNSNPQNGVKTAEPVETASAGGTATGTPVQPKKNILSFIFAAKNADKRCDTKSS